MNDDQAARRLRAAAALLRKRAAAAPDKEWFLDHEDSDRSDDDFDVHDPALRERDGDESVWRVGCWGPALNVGGGQVAYASGWSVQSECRLGFAEWAALMGPQVAEPLAAWLDAVAAHIDAGTALPTDLTHDRPAALATTILETLA